MDNVCTEQSLFSVEMLQISSESFADSNSQHYPSANTIQLLQVQLRLLYPGDVIKLFIATTKAEIKAYNLNCGSEIRGVFQNKLYSLLKFSS